MGDVQASREASENHLSTVSLLVCLLAGDALFEAELW